MRLELPKQINARLEVVKKACTQAAYDAGNCGEAARIGVGSAVTSLLRDRCAASAYSVDGFVSEGQQPAELGWGAHARNFPRDGKRFDFGGGSAIYLTQPGASTRVRTWTPKAGHFHGFLITHGEATSIADYYTVREGAQVVYRPTCHYAYHPCDAAVVPVHEFAGRNWQLQDTKRILMDDITSGIDELGVLLAGHKKNAYWFGSQLSIEEARKLAPYNNATSLQVTVSVLSGMVWAMENPNSGMVEPDEMDFRRNPEICAPYLGTVTGAYTDWTPLSDREKLFPEDLDKTDPRQNGAQFSQERG